MTLLLLACTGAPTATADEDTAGPTDHDGFAVDDGDCDDGDAEVFPGAVEVPGNAVDENCDGSLYAVVSPATFAAAIVGASDDASLGDSLAINETESLIVLGAPDNVSRATGGTVEVYTGVDARDGGEPWATYSHAVDMAGLGASVGTVMLSDGSTAVLAALDPDEDQGGFCAWTSSRAGELTTARADACVPAFVGPREGVGWGIVGSVDMDGDGAEDVLEPGVAWVDDEARSALWLAHGPVGLDALGTAPDLLAVSDYGFSTVADIGDVTGDGYADLALSYSLSPNVRLVPGGSGSEGLSTSTAGFDGPIDVSFGLQVVPFVAAGVVANLCISAHMDDSVLDRAGAIYCFDGPFDGRRSTDDSDLVIRAEAAGARCGRTLAALDTDNDGTDELAFGCAQDEPRPGLVYLYDLLAPEAPLRVFRGEQGELFGRAIAAGDADGDGRDDLLIGAAAAEHGHGAAWLISGASGAW